MRISSSTYRSSLRIALATAAVLSIPLAATALTEEVNWGVFDFALAAALMTGAGLLLELVFRAPGSVAYPATATVVGIGAMLLGEADDAPGLVLFGLLLIAGTLVLTLKRARRCA